MATTTKVRVTLHDFCKRRASTGRCLEKSSRAVKTRTVTFTKKGSKASLCTPRKIKIGKKTIFARPGGRALCGPNTGKNTPAAKAARAAFKKMVKGHRRSRRHSRKGRR